jgi:hypothetical protein
MRNPTLILCTTLAAAASLAAQNAFPLPASAGSTTSTQNTAPFVVPARMVQTRVVDRFTLQAAGLGASLNTWDMVAFDSTGRHLFVPCENFAAGGGIFRYDTVTGAHVEIWRGNGAGANNRNSNPTTFNPGTDDTVANDPCSWTPWNTIVFGEEATGGRFFECTNPLSPTGPFNIVWRSKVPAVSQEGMRFDSAGNLYFIDEDNSGCIYKFVPTTLGDLSDGQTFVLSVNSYANDPNAVPTENFNSTANRLTTRLGPATWVALTGPGGAQITPTNPFLYVTTTGGRTAADEVFGTPFGRPEDMDLNTLASGRQALYIALTSENRVLSIELLTPTTCMVRDFVNYDTINLATGLDVNPAQSTPFQSAGSGTVLNNPDNIAVDAFGGVYICEDANPGDIWKAIDANRDGIAEGIGIFVTLGVGGSEPTGIIFDPSDPYRCVCCVQHPSNGNDAIWAFDTRPYDGSDADLQLLTGVNALPRRSPGEFVREAHGFDTVVVKVDSEGSTYYAEPFAVLIQPFGTAAGQPAFLPPLWMNPFGPTWVLFGGLVGQFSTVLPFGGASTGVVVPPGLLGLSIMVQGIVVSSQSTLVLTDGVEVILK